MCNGVSYQMATKQAPKVTSVKHKEKNCHFFYSGQVCPYEELGCKFIHKYSEKCKHGTKCTFHMC